MVSWKTDRQIDEKYYIHPDGDKGYIFEVDLEYPGELHELHNDYPVAAEKMKVSPDMLSPYCKMIKEKYWISIGQVAKLIQTLVDKKNHVLHYRNLPLYFYLGLKMKKVHRVLEFNHGWKNILILKHEREWMQN